MRGAAAAVLTAALAGTGAGCAVVGVPGCPTGTEPAVLDTLYFGASRPDGTVTDDQWRAFLGAVVTPEFPAGLTVLEGSGQWRGRSGNVETERSRVLQLVHPGDRSSEEGVLRIVDRYRTGFHQEAVLRVREPTCVSF